LANRSSFVFHELIISFLLLFEWNNDIIQFVFIKQIIKFFSFLMSNDSPKQMAWGISLALLFSLMPGFNLIHFILLFVIFMLQVHLPSFFMFAFLFKLINGYALLLVHELGSLLLNIETLKGFYTLLYNIPIVPYTKFNNTAVLGGLIVGLVLLIPAELIFVKLVLLYRKKVSRKDKISFFNKLKIIKNIKIFQTLQLYMKYRDVKKVFR